MTDFYEKLIAIDPSKKCLQFLAKRVLSNNYRGMQISQHNRYTVNDLIILLENMYKMVGMGKMIIRTTDLSKRSYNTPDEFIYAEYVDNVSKTMGRCTQDSVRKNLFVDLHRMGLIYRYNKHEERLLPHERSTVKYVSLTETGKELVDSKTDPFKKNFIYTQAIDNLTKGLATDLFDIALIDESGKLNIYEFMFFISFINFEIGGHIYSKAELIDYLLEYRSMSFWQKEAIVMIIDTYCDPRNFSGNKTAKRDFHNWKNESQQIFMLIKDTVFFEQRHETLVVKIGENGIFENSAKLKRSLQAKQDYFKNHNVSKKIGFELHHIVPLLIATTRNEFDVLDTWENMIYIDGYTHSIISQTKNKHMVLDFENDTAILSDKTGVLENVVCKHHDNIEYDLRNQEIMEKYNSELLNAK